MLSPWPQLLNIFTDYLDCSEAIKADVVSVTMCAVVCTTICYHDSIVCNIVCSVTVATENTNWTCQTFPSQTTGEGRVL